MQSTHSCIACHKSLSQPQYLQPAYGDVIVDMSCGSGLFTRKFARSGAFSGVIGADFSESMLDQARQFLQQDGSRNSGCAAPCRQQRAALAVECFAPCAPA